MPTGFQIPGQAYDPYTGEPLNPDEQEAYARLIQNRQPLEQFAPPGFRPPEGFNTAPKTLEEARRRASLEQAPPETADLGFSQLPATAGNVFLAQAGQVGQILDTARGGLSAALTPDTGLGFTDRVKAGASRPEQYPFRNAAGIRNLSDEDIALGLSPRDIVGGVADIALDPSNYLPLGAAGKADDSIRGALKGARAAADDVAESSTRGILRQAGDTPGAVQRATDVPFRPRLSGASDDTAAAVRQIADSTVPGEKPAISLLRQYEGRVNTQGLNIRREMDEGNRILKSLDIGKPTGTSRIVERTPEVEDLYRALHGEVEPPPKFASVFERLKAGVDAETQAAIDFDPKFMAHPDYFPRGWKEVEIDGAVAGMQNPGSGVMGATPGFAKPRVDATFSEILDNVYTRPDGSTYRLEPASWNPFEQLALRKVAGAEYREQTALIDKLKFSGTAVPVDGPVPNGYRIPQVGPAFEGKPKIAPSEDGGKQFFGFTSRYAVPDNVADVLENMYGRKPDLGKTIESILNVGQSAKRVKLLASLFQQVDFATRTGVYTFGGALDDLIAGKPISAVTKVARLPVDLGKQVAANLSPKRRELLRDEILSGESLFTDRPGISLKGIAEAGWNQQDITIVRRDLRSAIRGAVDGESLTDAAKRNLQRLEAANSRGLFDGVYPQAQITSLKNWVLPNLMRQHPDWTDQQIMGSAASEINKAFSTLGDYQTIFKNPYVQHIARNLIFSTNEPEALLRGAGSAFKGENKRLWQTAYAGGFLFLASVANLVHAASTAILDGKPEFLPLDRYNPVRKDDETPLGYSYNSRFLSPDTPLTNGGRRLALDLMGQMDTALRVLDPVGFISGRTNVIPRAIANQIKGEDFFGNPIDQIGPKGVVSRGAQLASDLFEPISAGQVRNAAGFNIGEGEPVGAAGGLVQAGGVNLRAEPLKDTVARNDYFALSPVQQVKAFDAQTWGVAGKAPNVPQALRDEIAKYPSHFEWRAQALEKYQKRYIDAYAERGRKLEPGIAQALAERALEQNPIQQVYSQGRNAYEKQWVAANPQLAVKVMNEDAKLPQRERRLSLNLEELAFIIRESQKN